MWEVECGEEGGEAGIGDDDEAFFGGLDGRLSEESGRAVMFANAQGERVESIIRGDEEEGMESGAREVAQTGEVAQGAFRSRREGLDEESSEVVIEEDIFEVAMELGDSLGGAADRGQLAGVMSEQGMIERKHFVGHCG